MALGNVWGGVLQATNADAQEKQCGQLQELSGVIREIFTPPDLSEEQFLNAVRAHEELFNALTAIDKYCIEELSIPPKNLPLLRALN